MRMTLDVLRVLLRNFLLMKHANASRLFALNGVKLVENMGLQSECEVPLRTPCPPVGNTALGLDNPTIK